MTAKEWLNRGWELDKEINQLLISQERAFSRALKSTAAADGERVQQSRRNSSEDKFISYAEYSAMADKRIDELYEIKKEILAAVNRVKDPTLRTLLIARYINFKTWERIAEEMHYSYVHVVHNLHPRALNEIDKIVNSI